MGFTVKIRVKILKRFSALENLNESVNASIALQNIAVNTKTSAEACTDRYERKHHKLCFDEKC